MRAEPGNGNAGSVHSEPATDDPDELLPERPAARLRWWLVLGVVILVAVGVQVVRHSRVEVVTGTGRTAVAPAIALRAPLSSVVGNRCPTAVVCGVSPSVTPGMSAQFQRDFPGATVSLQASAFDAGAPRTYWQQISATTSAGTVVVVTEQRLNTSARPRSGTTHSPDGATVTVRQARKGWVLIADLLGDGPSGLPVAAAQHWVAAAPLPR